MKQKTWMIAAFAVYNLAEQPFSDHLHHHQLVPVIAAVFQQHAVDPGLFIGVDQLPAVIQRIRAAHFGTGLLPAFHSVAAGRDMVFPGGSHHNHVYIGRFTYFSVVQGDLGGVAVLFFHNLGCCSCTVFIGVTYVGYAYIFSFGQVKGMGSAKPSAEIDFKYSTK